MRSLKRLTPADAEIIVDKTEAAAMCKKLLAPLRGEYDAAVEGAIATYKDGWLDELRMAKKRR